MLGKELLDLGAVGVQLTLQGAQHPGAGQGQPAFGPRQGLAGDELAGPGEDLQTLLIGLGPGQPMGVQELLPLAPASLLQELRRGEPFDKGPGAGQRPNPQRLPGTAG